MSDVTGIQSGTAVTDASTIREDSFFSQAGKKLHNWWYADTVSSASSAPSAKLEPVASIERNEQKASTLQSVQENISWLWNMVWRTSSGTNTRIDNLSISAQQVDEKTRKMFADQMVAMQQHIQKLDEEYQDLINKGQDSEHVLIKVLALLIKNQLKLKEDQRSIAVTNVTSNRKRVKESLVASDKIQAENESLSKTQKIAKVAASVVGAAAGIAALVTLAVGASAALLSCATLGFVSLGTAAGGTLGAYGTIGLNAAAATTGLLKDYLSGKLDESKKQSLLLQAKKELEQDQMTVSMDEIKASVQEIATVWAMLKEVAERQNEASKSISRS